MVYKVWPIKYKFKLNVKVVKAFKVRFRFINKELIAFKLSIRTFELQFSL